MPRLEDLVDRGRIDNLFGKEINEFCSGEKAGGAAKGTVSQHRVMVYNCLHLLLCKRKSVRLDRITGKDMDSLLSELRRYGVKNPVSQVRTFAVFVSLSTGMPMLIDPGSYGRACGNRAMLLADKTGSGPRRSEGDESDRRRIEESYREPLRAFSEHEEDAGLSPPTRCTHAKNVRACIFVLEKRLGALDLQSLGAEDLDYVEAYLRDFGISDTARYINAFASFLSVATGKPPVIDIEGYGVSRPGWSVGLKDGFRFRKELDGFLRNMAARGVGEDYLGVVASRVTVCSNLLDSLVGPKALGGYGVSDMETLESSLSGMTGEANVRSHIQCFSNFVSYAAGNDLYRDLRESRNDHIAFEPETDQDRRFLEKLREYAGYLKEWECKPATIKGRMSSISVCYKALRSVKGDFELEDVDPVDFRKLRTALAGYTEATARNYLYTFGWFIKFATGYDPFPDARIRFNGETVRRKFIFNDEWVELYRAADVTERLILGLGASMGLRRREIVSIELDDIKGDKLYVKGKGTGTGKVEIMAMSELVRRDLGPYLEHRERVLSEYGDRSNGRLFINERMRNVGRPMSVRALETVLDGLVKRSGVSFSPHCLRRFFATTMKDAGVDLDTLRRMMRHSSIDTTLRCYIYADPRKMGAAVGAVDRAFGALV